MIPSKLVALATLALLANAVAAQDASSDDAAATVLPPDGEQAMQALLDSPRHGEWVDVPLASDDEPSAAALKTWIVYPERSDKAPVVLVVHEIFGMTDWIRAVADRLAAEGFIAVAPDLLSGKGPGGGGTESFAGDAVRAAIRQLDAKEVAQRLDAARTYATKLPSATNRTACTGFCWGGSTTFQYATTQPALRAAIVWYGTAPEQRDDLGRIECPVLGLYGGDDARVTSTVDLTRTQMAELGKTYRTRVYEGAGHGFLRRQSGRDGANARAAKQAWTETLQLLRRRLEPSSS